MSNPFDNPFPLPTPADNLPSPTLPLQFKPKNASIKRSNSFYHNKSLLLSRSPLSCLNSNSSCLIESPQKQSRPTSPSNKS